MAQLESKPEPFKRGQQTLSAEDLNSIVGGLLRQVRGGGGTDVGYYGDRVTISSKQPRVTVPGTGNYVCQMVVVREFSDYLLCVTFVQPVNDNNASTPQLYDSTLNQDSIQRVYVAKPYGLQQTPWNGKTVDGKLLTYTGIGTRTSDSTAQTLTPKYVPGEIIFAAKASTGYYDPDNPGIPIGWMDTNTAGRNWQQSTSSVGVWESSFFISDGVTTTYDIHEPEDILHGGVLVFVNGMPQTNNVTGGPLASTYGYRIINHSTIQFGIGALAIPPNGAIIFYFALVG